MGYIRSMPFFKSKLISLMKKIHLFPILAIPLFTSLIVFLPFIWAMSQDSGQRIREPVFAGMFYPSNRDTLARQINSYMEEAEKNQSRIRQHIFGIISPHAGYEYSGKVAAYGFSQLKGKSYKTVIIIGSSHQVPFRGVSVYPGGQWRTPLGVVSVDSDFVQALMKECRQIKTYPAPFANEHSLEVQLPFLQSVLKDFRIVPLITGGMDKNEYGQYVDGIVNLIKKRPKDILIVASSDMSHFHDYNTARSIDAITMRHIDEMDAEGLIEDMDSGRCELCGGHGVVMLIMIARRINGEVKKLNYMNSGDVAGDRRRVVGYSSFAFFYRDEAGSIDKKGQKMLIDIARKTLEEYVIKERIPEFDIKDRQLLEKRGVFVTLKKKGELRGCIGYIQPVLPLHKAVVDMTVAASTRDMRFIPVHKGELKDIKIEISVLSPLKPIHDIQEIETGRHGLYIKKGNYSGLLLPQVAKELGWDREEFLRQTCVKAGLYRNAWKDKKTEIYTFEAQIITE